MYQHDTRNSGYNAETTGPTQEVGEAWTFETDGEVRSSPAVVKGTVYIGSSDGNLYAVDMASGEQEWVFETGGPIESSPAVVDELVYVGSMDHNVYAVDVGSGEEQWAFRTGDGVRSSPTVAKDLLHAPGPEWREHGIVAIGSDDGNAYILDGKTGEKKFEVATDGPVVSTPWISRYDFSNGGSYLWFNIGSTDGSVYGSWPTERGGSSDDSYNRNEVYKFNVRSPIHSSITVNSDPTDSGGPDIFGADDGKLHYKAEGSFHESWEFQTGGKIRSSPALVEDPAVVFVGSWDGSLYAVAVETGEKLWAFETGGKVESSPAAADGVVYVGSADQHLYALDAVSGELLWDFRTGGAVYSSPAVVNGTVIVGSNDGHVYALTACQ